MDKTPPPGLDHLFIIPEGSQLADRFTFGPGWLKWLDEVGDDHGPGTFQYPLANYPPGSWDIQSFEVRWDDSKITMSFRFGSLSNPWGAPAGFSLPVVDVYIDLNHVAGAGCENLLPGREARVDSRDAWEYAVCVTGWGASLYRSTSATEFSTIKSLEIHMDSDQKGFTVEVPKPLLRGNPMNWGYAVGVAPKGRFRPTDPFDLMPIAPDPGLDAFGGAAKGKVPSAFVDILVPEDKSQETVLSAYAQDRPAILPMLRVQPRALKSSRRFKSYKEVPL